MSGWMLPKVTDYWDQQVSAIDGFARRLDSLDEGSREDALDSIAAAVREHVRVLPDETLATAVVCVVDDIYRAACATDRLDGGLTSYLEKSAATFMSLVAERGIAVQYVVDNEWEDMARPVQLFPAWYQAAGLTYICPQVVLLELISEDKEAAQADPGRYLIEHIDEARGIVVAVIEQCQATGRHFFQLDADSVETSFAAALSRAGAPGVLTVFRNQAPEPGSTVEVWHPGTRD